MKFGLFCALGLFAVAVPGRCAVLVPGFTEAAFQVPGLFGITDIEWAPDASRRLFITDKEGIVRIMLQSGQLLEEPFAVITPVYTQSECGLVGICFDPNFLVNRFVYFFVTVSDSEQQIIRYQDANNIGINKTVLVGGLPTIGANHDGGGIGVGLDGKLYFSIGDLGDGTGVDSDLTSLASKVGRRNLDGTIPTLNPFVDGPAANNDSIWARGFRNPFKLAVQPTTGQIWVNVAGAGYEQVFSLQKSDHAGWNNYENTQPTGFITPRIKYRTNGADTRQITPGGGYWHSNIITFTTTAVHGFRSGERITIAGVLPDPTFNGTYYIESIPSPTTFTVFKVGPHVVGGGGTATTLNMGGAITGGCFYNSSAFPDGYRQNYFFCDYNSGRVNRATIDATNDVTSVDYFVNGIQGAVDVATGPNGHLYYAGHGISTIYRLVYTNNPQKIVHTPNYLNMAEGGKAVAHVRLTLQPASDVTITITPPANPAFSTTNLSLTFTPANYFDTQPVYIDVAGDPNPFHSQAVFTLSSPGLPSRTLNVNAYDPQHGNLAFTAVVRTNQSTRLQVGAEPRTRVALEGSTNSRTWQPFTTNLIITNVATVIDNTSPGPHRLYRARIVP